MASNMELIFGKSLKKTDVGSRLSVPVKSLKKLPHFEGRHVVDLPVRDKGDSFWRFHCSIRKRGHFRKPVLRGDWHRFAVSKGLSVGDEVKLFKEIDQATGALLHYRVEVKRSTKIFGFPIIQHAPVLL